MKNRLKLKILLITFIEVFLFMFAGYLFALKDWVGVGMVLFVGFIFIIINRELIKQDIKKLRGGKKMKKKK